MNPEPVFFTDRDLGKKFPEMLRAAGLKERGWIAITHDGRIRYKPNELAAVMQHGVALLVVAGHAPYSELAQAFIGTRPRILNFLERHKPPYIAKIYRPSPGDIASDPSAVGRIELWHPKTAAKAALKPNASGKLRGS